MQKRTAGDSAGGMLNLLLPLLALQLHTVKDHVIVERSGARFRSRVRPSGRRLGVFDRVAMQALPVGVRGWRAGVAMGCMPAAHQLWRQGGVVGTWVYNARACCVVCDTVSSA